MNKSIKDLSLILFGLVVVITTNVGSAAADNAPKFSKAVSISVNANNTEIKSTIKSYIGRELRTLGDVEIVDQKWDYELRIIALNLGKKSSDSLGYALSIVVVSRNNEAILRLIQPSVPENIMKFYSDLPSFETASLVAGSTEKLKELCEELVTDFDKDVLERDRKFWRENAAIFAKTK